VQAALFEEPTLTVAELSDRIGRAVNRAFPDELWVRGEIHDLQRPPSGHVYFTLAGDGSAVDVTLWAMDKQAVNGVLTRAGGGVRMTDGTEVRIRARVAWFARRGRVSLRMLSIDPAYTLGRLAEERDVLVQALTAEGLLHRNRSLPMPLVPLRVGLVTAAGSAAAADFLTTLSGSALGWHVVHADARVQGVDAERSIVAALRALAAWEPGLDVIALVRGGGARTDLAAFDREPVARAIALLGLPVVTGIGHEVDRSVADLVAHASYKTPTACAAALVERVQAFCDRTERCWTAIGRASAGALGRTAAHLDERARRLAVVAPRALAGAERGLALAEARVRALDPVRTLARGWTITRTTSGEVVRGAAEVAPGQELVTVFADGEVRSRADG
jgi:exodeoxyribonuclease VII large subunit